jgi:ribosome-binding ATPase YchF (GTP1/OBG family)
VENRLKRIAHDLLRGVRGDIERESEILEKCKATLEAENPLRNAKFREEEIKRLRGFTFLSLKPLIIILNIGEGDIADCAGLAQKAGLSEAIAICAQMEAEINDLAPEDRPAFLKEIGIGECARDKILKKTREKLELITFFTANEKEAKAWDLKRGLPALKAAGAVHTDMEWGFIRAEAIHFADLQAHPSVHDLRSLGLIHLEGKEYVVQEGDVLLFRFSG